MERSWRRLSRAAGPAPPPPPPRVSIWLATSLPGAEHAELQQRRCNKARPPAPAPRAADSVQRCNGFYGMRQWNFTGCVQPYTCSTAAAATRMQQHSSSPSSTARAPPTVQHAPVSASRAGARACVEVGQLRPAPHRQCMQQSLCMQPLSTCMQPLSTCMQPLSTCMLHCSRMQPCPGCYCQTPPTVAGTAAASLHLPPLACPHPPLQPPPAAPHSCHHFLLDCCAASFLAISAKLMALSSSAAVLSCI
jgi:hypothetical protein